MSDLFHEDIPEPFIANIAAVMRLADWHTYQILTKRPKRLEKLLTGRLKDAAAAKHIWWGVTVENRRHGLPRIDALRRTGAAMKFLSIEPLLEDLGTFDLSGIDWVIVGGESGPGARPLKEEWVVSIQQQCLAARVPFFFKQWGGVQKSKAGRELNGRTWDEFPESRRVRMRTPDEKREALLKAIELLQAT
jgi:protein gp37